MLSFREFLAEAHKEEDVDYNSKTMKWIMVRDKNFAQQKVLIDKKDGEILGGMGGKENGQSVEQLFDKIHIQQQEEKAKDFKKEAVTGKDLANFESPEDEKNIINSILLNIFDSATQMNDFIYGKLEDTTVKETQKENRAYLDKIFKNVSTPEKAIIYLSSNESDELIKNIQELEIGDSYTEKGYTRGHSITVNDSIKVEVLVPRNSKIIYHENDNGVDILINRNTEFRLMDKDDKSITVKIIND